MWKKAKRMATFMVWFRMVLGPLEERAVMWSCQWSRYRWVVPSMSTLRSGEAVWRNRMISF